MRRILAKDRRVGRAKTAFPFLVATWVSCCCCQPSARQSRERQRRRGASPPTRNRCSSRLLQTTTRPVPRTASSLINRAQPPQGPVPSARLPARAQGALRRRRRPCPRLSGAVRRIDHRNGHVVVSSWHDRRRVSFKKKRIYSFSLPCDTWYPKRARREAASRRGR